MLRLIILPQGQYGTIFEAPVQTKGPFHVPPTLHRPTVPIGRKVTPYSGGTHCCNGLNKNANPTPGRLLLRTQLISPSFYTSEPGPTITSALADAADLAGFTFDGKWYPSLEDFMITRIANTQQTDTEYWGLWLDYKFLQVGGCQQKVTDAQDILWGFGASKKKYLLKLAAASEFALVGEPYAVTVLDGLTGDHVEGATVGGVTTDEYGAANITFNCAGIKRLKAEAPDSLRSNTIKVNVNL